jgi:hypothetical protein
MRIVTLTADAVAVQGADYPTATTTDHIEPMNLWSRLDWFNIAGIAFPALLAVWFDRRAGRRRKT